MTFAKGQIWWADLGEPIGSEPAYNRPVVIISSDSFNKSKINTVVCAILTSNLNYRNNPGNVFLEKKESKLLKHSIINMTLLVTLNKFELTEFVSQLHKRHIQKVNQGLKILFNLNAN